MPMRHLPLICTFTVEHLPLSSTSNTEFCYLINLIYKKSKMFQMIFQDFFFVRLLIMFDNVIVKLPYLAFIRLYIEKKLPNSIIE